MEKYNFSPASEEKGERERYIEALKNLSRPDGIEVLQNLEINDKNLDLSITMAKIEQEMEQRRIVLKSKKDKDTGEVKNLKTTSEFEKLKGDTLKETRKELTKPSKYIKGTIAFGILATGFAVDGVTGSGEISQFITETFNTSWDTASSIELVGLLSTGGATLYNLCKAAYQEIKSRKVTNQKVQRILGMIGLGMEKKEAQEVVGLETKKDKKDGVGPFGGYAKAYGYDVAGKETKYGQKLPIEAEEKIAFVRKTLKENGIEIISREKNQG